MDKIPVQYKSYKMKVIVERCQLAMGVTIDVSLGISNQALISMQCLAQPHYVESLFSSVHLLSAELQCEFSAISGDLEF